MEEKAKIDDKTNEKISNEINEIIVESIIKEYPEDINKAKINEIKPIIEQINKDFLDKNYKKVEENCKLIFDDKNIESLENINKEINIIKLLNNYAISLYKQMKYEPAAKILFKIIVNYDNKNKEAYLLFLRILFDINEYQKANLLIEKVNKIVNNNDLEEFNEIGKEIESELKIKNNNIKRQYYFNAQKDIFCLQKQLHFFYWIFYSIAALIVGNYLSKIILK